MRYPYFPDDPEDQKLVQQALHGDQKAFTSLFNKYNLALCRFIMYIVGNHDDMQDMAQETFEKAYKRLHRLESGASFKSWLYKIAKHTAIDCLRKRQRRYRLLRMSPQESQEDMELIVDIELMIEEQVIQAILVELAWKKTQEKLTLTQVTCFIWYHQGEEIEEIAHKFKLTKGTVATYISKANTSLYEEYRRLQSDLQDQE